MPDEPMNANEFAGNREELAILRREMDQVQQERLSHVETKLSSLDEWVRLELANFYGRIENRLVQYETMLIDRAAQMAVKRAFSHLGVNVDDATELQRFRDDLRFGGVFRNAATKSFFAMIAAIFGGIGLSIWMAFKDQFGWK